jgi:hypothetical protein
MRQAYLLHMFVSGIPNQVSNRPGLDVLLVLPFDLTYNTDVAQKHAPMNGAPETPLNVLRMMSSANRSQMMIEVRV